MKNQMISESTPILEVKDLAISYKTRKGEIPAVQGVNFTVRQKETVGLVGESGCGKSTIAFGILLIEIHGFGIFYYLSIIFILFVCYVYW